MKKLLLVLCMITCILTLSAFSSASNNSETLDTTTVAIMESTVSQLFELFYTIDDAQLEIYLQQMKNANNPIFINAFETWRDIKDKLGSYVSTESVDVTKVDNGYMATVSATFEKQSMTFSIVVNEAITEYVSIQFNLQQSETIFDLAQKGDPITLVCIAVVVLVFIGIIFYNKNKYQSAEGQPQTETLVSIPENPSENLIDDMELVAVITAAIAAVSGTPADGLVVRSIRRAKTSNWKKA